MTLLIGRGNRKRDDFQFGIINKTSSGLRGHIIFVSKGMLSASSHLRLISSPNVSERYDEMDVEFYSTHVESLRLRNGYCAHVAKSALDMVYITSVTCHRSSALLAVNNKI